ncbi:MAG: phosphopyruvate hydratase [Gemmataceae bacterium]|nr:phosphopyruvate hydratase [Gemmataceae bacterium]
MSHDTIARIHAREVLDSRGNPTVEVRVQCAGGACGRAIVPSGASTGKHEACELRDGDPKRYAGKGVTKAVANVREILAPALVGMPASDQAEIDRLLVTLDGTPNKSRLGANALLGVSLACVHAAAAARKLPLWHYLAGNREPSLPLPMVNLISGGLHAGRNLEFQDFLFLPVAARTFSEALELSVAVYRSLGETLRQHGFEGILVGDEGGYGPRLESNDQAIEMILRAFEKAGLTPGKDSALALDVASTHFYEGGRYTLRDRVLTAEEFTELLCRWVDQYPIASIEDGMAEDDWAGWKLLTDKLGRRVQLIGDDLFATNPERFARGSVDKVANSILIKLNQIGTLTETLSVIDKARAAGYRPVISARSGETEDTTIADLAVATAAGQIKIGSIVRGERLAKYNQLLRIEEQVPAFSRWQRV